MRRHIFYLTFLLFLFSKNTQQAQTKICDSLLTLAKSAGNDSLKSKLYYKISWEYIVSNDLKNALYYANQSLALAERSHFKFGKAVAYQYLGTIHGQLKNQAKAAHSFQNSMKLWKELNDMIGVSDVQIGLADINAGIGNYAEALSYYDSAIKVLTTINDKRRVAIVQNNMGIIYYNQGEFKEALNLYLKALKNFEEVNDQSGLADSYNNVGSVLLSQRNLNDALKKYYKALEIRKKINDKKGIATSYNNIGITFKEQKKFIQATEKLNKALQYYKEINDLFGMSNAYSNLGVCYLSINQFDNAIANFKNSLDLRIKSGDKKGLAICYHNIGSVYIVKNQYEEARSYLLKALSVSQTIHDKETLLDIYKDMAINDSLTGNYAASSRWLFKLNALKDSVFNSESNSVINDLNIRYETEKKDKEITILNKDKQLNALEIQNQKIKAKQKNIFLASSILILLIIIVFSYFLFKRFKLVSEQKKIIELKEIETNHQKELIQEKQNEILDSIHYAKRIQNALITNAEFINENLPESFVYFNPKDIVSGDFYWATENNNKFYLAICDSTGHGVPGAFMSLLNMEFLSEAIKEKNIEKPNEIFEYVRDRLISSISTEGQKDGMDGILLCYDKKLKTFEYTAANNEPILIRNGKITELGKDKMPVGKGESTSKFTLHTLDLKQGDRLYLYTDGFADQFGGPKGKKFKYKQLNELLLSLNNVSPHEQKQVLEETFKAWKGSLEQVDDVLIAGIRV